MTVWTGEAPLGRSYWEDTVGPVDPVPPADLPEKTEILIAGSGYTGLSAAIAAHDAGANVVVVEAKTTGFGASTRNGGMFGAHPRLGWDALNKAFGPQVADQLFAEAAPALKWAKDLIKKENIDCDLQSTGRISLAWTKPHLDRHHKLAATVKAKSDVDVEIIDQTALGHHISTEKYFGGILFPEHCAIHPAKFHLGLRKSVEKRGIPIVENCALQHVSGRPGAFEVSTSRGTIAAEQVILGTGGYTPHQMRWHHKRIIPLPSYIIATEELSENLIGELAPGRHMMVETRARHSYYRISPNGKRILWGGRAAMVPINLEKAAVRLQNTMAEVWPVMGDVKLSHVWTGNTGYSFTHMPTVGTHKGIHYSMGYSGSGTVAAPYLGAKAAYRALGDARGETAYAETYLKPHWMHQFSRPYFLYAADLWYHHWVDRWETRAGR